MQAANTEAQASWSSITEKVEQTSKDLGQGMDKYSQKVNDNWQGALTKFDDELSEGMRNFGEALSMLADMVAHLDNLRKRQEGQGG